MSPIVAVIAPGMMGSAVAKRLTTAGLEVCTLLEGRSAESRTRAAAARMRDVNLNYGSTSSILPLREIDGLPGLWA